MIKTIGIISKNPGVKKAYKKEIEKAGFRYSLKSADLILSIGGDGTLLESERTYPGVPKMMIKDSEVCNKCNIGLFDKFLDIIIGKQFKIETHDLLEAYINNKRLPFLAVNDIIIRNSVLTQAIRFDFYSDNKKVDNYIGDGAVISTPWGSTAYFESISKTSFKKGIGVALNNVNKQVTYKVYDKSSKIKFIITRGKAVVGCDNYRKSFSLKPYDEIVIKYSTEKMSLVKPL